MQVPPCVPAMRPQEPLQLVVDVVYGVHRVFAVPKPPAALRLPVAGVDLDEGLVEPYPARENHPVLAPFQGGEYLRKPVFSGAFGVSVVPGRRFDGMELEELEQELHPFRKRDLPGAEQRPGQRVERAPASAARVLLHPSGLLPFLAILPHPQNGQASGAAELTRAISSGDGLGCFASCHSHDVLPTSLSSGTSSERPKHDQSGSWFFFIVWRFALCPLSGAFALYHQGRVHQSCAKKDF